MRGKNISPELIIKGLGKIKKQVKVKTNKGKRSEIRMHIVLQDGNCTWGCNSHGKFNHWVLDFPIKAMKDKTNKHFFTKDSVRKNAGNNKEFQQLYTEPNGLKQKI